MKTINAAKDLSPEKVNEFVTLADNNLIDILIEGLMVGKDTMPNVVDRLYSDEIKQFVLNNEIKISLKTPEVELQFIGQDYNWYNENTRRKNKLMKMFSTTEQVEETKKVEEPKKEEKKIYKIAIADISEKGIENVDSIISSSKSEIVRFMNNKIVAHAKSETEESMYVFNLDYQDGDENDITKWSTLDDLVAQGKVVLK